MTRRGEEVGALSNLQAPNTLSGREVVSQHHPHKTLVEVSNDTTAVRAACVCLFGVREAETSVGK